MQDIAYRVRFFYKRLGENILDERYTARHDRRNLGAAYYHAKISAYVNARLLMRDIFPELNLKPDREEENV